jgi:hypothetical protein
MRAWWAIDCLQLRMQMRAAHIKVVFSRHKMHIFIAHHSRVCMPGGPC